MRTLFTLIAFFVVLVGGGVARADRNPIVLEVYTGGKQPQMDRLIRPILDELQGNNYEHSGAVAIRFENDVSRPVLNGGLPSDFESSVEKAYNAFTMGQPAKAMIVRAVEDARKNPGAFVEAEKQEALQKALITLALIQKQEGDLGAMKDAYRDLVRSFPRGQVPRSVYGPEAGKAFDDVKREIAATNQKRLSVKLDGGGGAVYANENFRGNGPAVSVNLWPGEYRVFVKFNSGQLSRSHRVVIAGSDAELAIIGGFDTSVHAANDWTGFAFANASDREKYEGVYAQQLANAIGAPQVAIVGIDQTNGKVVGALINLKDGSDIRRGSVTINSSPDQLRNLARFIASDQRDGVTVLPSKSSSPSVEESPTTKIVETPHDDRSDRGGGSGGSGGLWGGYKWISGSAAGIGLATAGFLLYRNGRCSKDVVGTLPCPDVYNYAVPGYLTLGGGAALAAVTVVLYLRGRDKAPSRTAFVAPTTGGAVAGFSTSF